MTGTRFLVLSYADFLLTCDQAYILVCICVPLLYMASAGSVAFWLITICGLLTLAHAYAMDTPHAIADEGMFMLYIYETASVPCLLSVPVYVWLSFYETDGASHHDKHLFVCPFHGCSLR